jgi:hypothetical protein
VAAGSPAAEADLLPGDIVTVDDLDAALATFSYAGECTDGGIEDYVLV